MPHAPPDSPSPAHHADTTAHTTHRPADVLVRTCRVDDVAVIHAIYAHHVTHGTGSFEITPPTLAAMHERHAAILAQDYPFFVCESAGLVLGFAYASAFRARPGFRYTVEDSVYVDAAYCGRGIGQQLLQALIERCTAQGFRQMVAMIGDRHNHASLALHAAQGFKPTGTLTSTGWKHGRWLDTVLMQRPLGAGDQIAPAADE
jgi:L-amino acid N-acyltransferase YncA